MNNINLYFVVPPDVFEKFSPQKYKTAKGEDCQKIPGWINKITQYALEINLGINNKGANKRSNDAISGDDKNEDTSRKGMDNKDVKKRKTKKSDATLGDDEIEETSKKGINKKDVKKRKTKKRR